ncbi:hypothetical protein KAU51_00355 [Candidatus Parcubacteria bacterium]|nr:hypothetical protein [Candidatus Parcubacteria bacterium]
MNYLKLYKTIIILSTPVIICGLILPQVVFAQTTVETPSTFTEAKDFIIRLVKPLPNTMKDIWQNQVLPVWRNMAEKFSNWWKTSVLPWLKSIMPTLKSWFNETAEWFSGIWYETIKPWISNLLNKIKSFINEKIIERKPVIKQEFEKEKQEIKQEIPEVSKGLWQRFKELIK